MGWLPSTTGARETMELRATRAALDKAQAVIEFNVDGTILNANPNFLAAVNYSLDEIRGQHHRIFVDAAYAASAAYAGFWQKLARGEFDGGQYKRIGKGGREIWIQATYNPILDGKGRVAKIIKFATDITEQKLMQANHEGQLAAINKAQAVIEFDLNGTILDANENFQKTLGYDRDEIIGRHHSLFVEPDYRTSAEYRRFWDKLSQGEYDAGQYRRLGKGGREIWIQASYNPIKDMDGKPFKVVKYATDITAQVVADQSMKLAVQQANSVIAAAEQQDLTQRIPVDDKGGEIRNLCHGVNSILETMCKVITEINASTAEVNNAAAEIAASTVDLSQRTEEQAASLEQTSASMEEIAATVKKNAENAQSADKSSIVARETAESGRAIVAHAIEAMSKIEQSSGRIADIIGVIDEIARQTNLLALNAAVEAARAGEAGRGFAVVASEVRSLAQRSSQAAKDIKGLITSSNGQVKDGVELVNKAGQSLSQIMESVKGAAAIVADIASASAEQAIGVAEVNKALTQMDEVTQQNSALVEENAATAKTLEQQANDMHERIKAFKTSTGERTQQPHETDSSSNRGLAKPRQKPSASRPPARSPIGRMQTSVATAFKQDEWREF